MTIFRNPVFDPKTPGKEPFIIHPLVCVDVEHGGDLCKRMREAHPKPPPGKKGKRFVCPNRGAGPGHCSSWTFKYPRRWGSDGSFHFHQGIDIFARAGTPIRSVTTGKVVYASLNAPLPNFGGYGLVVVIQSNVLGRSHYFLYAHCDSVHVSVGDDVSEQQIIATVGTTCGSVKNPETRFPSASEAHLHFEVSTRRYPFDDEREPGDVEPDQGRVDPQAILERLGPWGMSKVYLPLGEVVDADVGARAHSVIESSPHGGFFDIDPTSGERTGNKCQAQWEKYTGKSFNCPNHRSGGCHKGSFLYPRKRRSNGDFHFHQGIDVGDTVGQLILSVTSDDVEAGSCTVRLLEHPVLQRERRRRRSPLSLQRPQRGDLVWAAGSEPRMELRTAEHHRIVIMPPAIPYCPSA